MEIIAVFRIESFNDTKVTTYTKSQKPKKSKFEPIDSLPLFASEVIKIGRGKACDVRIDNPAISLHHATVWSVQFDSDTLPLVYLNDSSRNGLLHNGRDMRNGETRMLKDGDTIEFKTAGVFTYETLEGEEDTQDKSNITIETWNISDSLIGSGSFGSVFVASSTTNYHKLYAVKVLRPGSNNSEYDLLRGVQHLPLPKSRIYICDFGVAKKLTYSRTSTSVGTIEYSAPEVFNIDNKGKAAVPYGYKCDTWSLGIVTHVLLTGISPFYSESKEQTLLQARQGQLNFARKQFALVSKSAKEFLLSLLETNPRLRVDIDGCFECAWVVRNRSKLEKFYRDKIVGTQN
ncbi:hypothetical protein KGF57_001850 [Candida theae]|uniref:FHA domain-containing protein n=1 Tax=Candida theae TaxID=1198502 RepID=A0AAD5BGT0_9ASCO|nr:uncharacterized protein KGF57_001850 [Candida theae]KAI5960918.1 hypothetical protein KGF57_001850 [Candida theae]